MIYDLIFIVKYDIIVSVVKKGSQRANTPHSPTVLRQHTLQMKKPISLWNLGMILLYIATILLFPILTTIFINIVVGISILVLIVTLVIKYWEQLNGHSYVKIKTNHAGVLTVFAMRTGIIFGEGIFLILPFINDIKEVDMRARVVHTPRPDEGKHGYQVIAGVHDRSPIELIMRTVLKYQVINPITYLDYDPVAMEDALVNTTIDTARIVANMAPDEVAFMAAKTQLEVAMKQRLEAIPGYEKAIRINGVEIPKITYEDEETSRAKQKRTEEKAKSKAQDEDMEAIANRMEKLAEKLEAIGMTKADAAKKATELIQLQEGQKVDYIHTDNPIADLIAMFQRKTT